MDQCRKVTATRQFVSGAREGREHVVLDRRTLAAGEEYWPSYKALFPSPMIPASNWLLGRRSGANAAAGGRCTDQ
jgi:hypothetical protein